jgi:hypothetical protein
VQPSPYSVLVPLETSTTQPFASAAVFDPLVFDHRVFQIWVLGTSLGHTVTVSADPFTVVVPASPTRIVVPPDPDEVEIP